MSINAKMKYPEDFLNKFVCGKTVDVMAPSTPASHLLINDVKVSVPSFIW